VSGFAVFPIDAGAEWIHTWIEAKTPLLTKLLQAEAQGFPTFQDNPDGIKSWRNSE
jgi:hypothetical protein